MRSVDHGFHPPHRVEKVSEQSDVGTESPGIVPDPGICGGNSDLVVRSTRYEAARQRVRSERPVLSKR
jgi:hypothetical protein